MKGQICTCKAKTTQLYHKRLFMPVRMVHHKRVVVRWFRHSLPVIVQYSESCCTGQWTTLHLSLWANYPWPSLRPPCRHPCNGYMTAALWPLVRELLYDRWSRSANIYWMWWGGSLPCSWLPSVSHPLSTLKHTEPGARVWVLILRGIINCSHYTYRC